MHTDMRGHELALRGCIALAELKRIMVSVPSSLLSEVDVFSRAIGLNRSEVVREAVRMFMAEHARSELGRKLKEGYSEMASINSQMADECAAAEEEAFVRYERFLAGGD
jgi:CopG family transcriptional regulator/antitoxin EndoAI